MLCKTPVCLEINIFHPPKTPYFGSFRRKLRTLLRFSIFHAPCKSFMIILRCNFPSAIVNYELFRPQPYQAEPIAFQTNFQLTLRWTDQQSSPTVVCCRVGPSHPNSKCYSFSSGKGSVDKPQPLKLLTAAFNLPWNYVFAMELCLTKLKSS